MTPDFRYNLRMATSDQNPYEAPSVASPQRATGEKPRDGKLPFVALILCWAIMGATMFGIVIGLVRLLLWMSTAFAFSSAVFAVSILAFGLAFVSLIAIAFGRRGNASRN